MDKRIIQVRTTKHFCDDFRTKEQIKRRRRRASYITVTLPSDIVRQIASLQWLKYKFDGTATLKNLGPYCKLRGLSQSARTIKAPFTRYNLLSNRLSNRFDNRLYRVYSRLSNRLYNAVWQPVERTAVRSTRLSNRLSNGFDNRLDVCLHDIASCQTGCTTGLFDNRLYRVNGLNDCVVPAKARQQL